MMKKPLSILLALVLSLHLAVPALAAQAPEFSDVPTGHWAYAYVRQAAQAGAVNGTGNGRFNPEGTLTVAEFTAMLLRALYGEAPVEQYTGEGGEWYAPYTAYAYERDFYESTSVAGRLAACPEGGEEAFLAREMAWNATRYDMAAMLYQVLEADADGEAQAADLQWAEESAPEAVADWEEVPDKYQTLVAFCFRSGILTGMDGQGTFQGTGTVTRAQAAAILCRVLDRTAREPDSTAPAPETPEETPPEEPEYDGPLMPDGQPLTEENVHALIDGLRTEYPEGMHWTNENAYTSHALAINGFGCAAFALLCSDKAFGDLPSRQHSKFDDIRVGDMLRVRNNTHSVVVLEKKADSVIVTEGNYADSIHWDREITRENLESDKQFYVETRYPKDA